MQSNLNKLENNRVLLEMEADPQEVTEAFNQAYKKIVNKINVPGFRKGKVPRFMLEKQFGKEILYQDAIEILVSQGYYEALIKHKLDPVDNPKIDFEDEIEDGKAFKFTAEVEVLPEVTLGEYKGLTVEKDNPKVTDEDVDNELKLLQERHAELVGSDKKIVENGDFAIIDFDGYLDGKPFPGGTAQGYTVEIGAGGFIPGFEEGMIGMAPGEEKDVEVAFPEDYHQPDLAGKDVVFKIKLHEIKVKELPVLDDEFAKSLGRFESIEEYKEDIKKQIQEYKEQEANKAFENALVKKVVENSSLELTDTLIKRELERSIHNIEHDFAGRGLKLEEYLDSTNQSMEELQEELRPRVEENLKTDLVLSAIVEREGITVSEEEINKRLEYILQYYPSTNKEEMQNPSVIAGINASLEKEKAIKFLVDSTKPEGETAEIIKDEEKVEEVKEE